ncbi:ankyrin repeat-containing protein, partial [Fusarium austroafricanum]
MVELLPKHDADPDAVTQSSPHTALQIAAREDNKDVVEMLLHYGADFAVMGGYLDIAHLLLENGADTNAAPANIKGRTALEGAAEHGRIDIVQLLNNAGADISEAGQGQYRSAL